MLAVLAGGRDRLEVVEHRRRSAALASATIAARSRGVLGVDRQRELVDVVVGGLADRLGLRWRRWGRRGGRAAPGGPARRRGRARSPTSTTSRTTVIDDQHPPDRPAARPAARVGGGGLVGHRVSLVSGRRRAVHSARRHLEGDDGVHGAPAPRAGSATDDGAGRRRRRPARAPWPPGSRPGAGSRWPSLDVAGPRRRARASVAPRPCRRRRRHVRRERWSSWSAPWKGDDGPARQRRAHEPLPDLGRVGAAGDRDRRVGGPHRDELPSAPSCGNPTHTAVASSGV